MRLNNHLNTNQNTNPAISTLLINRTHHSALTYGCRFALVLVSSIAVSSVALAQSVDKKDNKKDEGPWSVSAGLFVTSSPEYEGGKKSVVSGLPDFNISYRTKDWGTFGVGSKSRGASWTIIDKEEYSFGIALGGDAGRTDKKKGTGFKPGSERLQGLGEIKPSAEFGVFGHVVAGIPISLQIMKGLGDNKADAGTFSIKGHGGTHVELSSEIPFEITKSLSLSFTPSLSWADSKYTQTYFGVTAAQAARTNFKQYNAKGGVKSIGFGVGLNYQLDNHWGINAGVAYNQLQSNAAKSPIVEKKGQPSALLGLTYKF
jgi:MipA family protein